VDKMSAQKGAPVDKMAAQKAAAGKQAYMDQGGAQKMGAAPAKDVKGGGGVLAPGTAVMAQWQDGNWHRARVAGFQNGSYGIDWEDPKLGASSWCAPHQVRPA
jgi:hypothetical protein